MEPITVALIAIASSCGGEVRRLRKFANYNFKFRS